MTTSLLLSNNPELAFVVATSTGAGQPDATAVSDWDRVVQLAAHHRVFPRTWSVAANSFPFPQVEIMRLLARENARAALVNVGRTCEAVALLRAVGIEPVVLKGPVLAQQLYGDYAARVSGDVDLLVTPAELLAAAQTLARAGYQHHTPITAAGLAQHRQSQHDVSFAHPTDRVVVELHADIAQPHYGYQFDLDKWRRESRTVQAGGTPLTVLSREHAYLLTALHAAKHRWHRLDLIADMAVYGQMELDFGKVQTEASQTWMLTSLRTGQALAAAFYGDGPTESGIVRDVSSKVVASKEFGRLDGLWLDLRLRERTRDRGRYLLKRLLSAKLVV